MSLDIEKLTTESPLLHGDGPPGDKSVKQRISENTLNKALHRMGYEGRLTGHGIRGTISAALNELG